MKKIVIFLFIPLFFLFAGLTSVKAYDPLSTQNNIYGIGIINHSDLEDSANLINSNGGDWGYVTIVITEKERNKEIWQKFMDDCRRNHLIPIIRIATNYDGKNWEIPNIDEIDTWINFFNSLNWVVENRYIIVANEPNHAKEWGGKIDPSSYATYLKTFADRLHNASKDYFVLNAGFDQSATSSKVTMDEKKYIDLMLKEVPDLFNFIDGWNSHSYPNPAFSGPKTGVGRKSIRGYEWELSLVKTSLPAGRQDLPIFITETGWVRTKKNEEIVVNNLKYAFEEVWSKDKRIVAVTPFILNYQDEPFYEFSWKNKDGSYFPIYSEIQNLPKIKGEPIQKISGEIIFNFLNPLVFKTRETSGFSIVRNTGQATWTEVNTSIVNEINNEIYVSNTKIDSVEPFNTGLVVYTLKTTGNESVFKVKLGFYVQGERIGELVNSKIISF